LGPGDVLVDWRPARSLRHLLQLIDELTSRGVGFRSLTESIDPTAVRLVVHLFGALGSSSATCCMSAPLQDWMRLPPEVG